MADFLNVFSKDHAFAKHHIPLLSIERINKLTESIR
jgi:hypothetical protein